MQLTATQQRPLVPMSPFRAAVAAVRRTLALGRADAVGRGARFDGRPYIENLGRIVVGDNLQLRSRPVVSHLVTGPRGVIEIGSDVVIAHGLAMAAHARVTVGDGAHIGPFAMIMDTDFHEVGNRDGAGASRPIRIGEGARIGSRVTILRGAVIGAGAEVLDGSVVTGEVRPMARVGGNPARELRADGAAVGAGAVTPERVAAVVTRTFGLAEPPHAATRREQVSGWDSLGTLNLLLSLEDAFGVTLSDADLLAVRSVGDLEAMLDAAATRR